ncbi:MAG: PIF1 family DEAD/DEAH box helicase [Patescibacteria group bacterium]
MTQGEALNILKTGANVFLTGEPGSGKTHTVNEYVSYLRSCGIEPAITASTGIAATHIGGMTIHSWSGIGIRRRLDKYDLDRLASNERIVKRVARAKVLIIDEISMLGPETLSMIEAVCREIKQVQEPFGGLQVILVGDFFQLPPVTKYEEQSNQQSLIAESIQQFSYESACWQNAGFIHCYITEQHRQEDAEFLSVLSAIRSNSYDEVHHSHIEKRKVVETNVPEDIPRLFSHNVDVDRVNDTELSKIDEEEYCFEMTEQGASLLVAALKKGCLSPEILKLKVGTKVMFTKNNFQAGFVNGTLGEIEELNSYSSPVVKLKNDKRIVAEPMDWTVEEGGVVKARISQVPLRLAWAITVHKSQGMSLDAAVMDLTDVFEFGQGYVALSRVRALSGLYLLGWNERTFQVHPDVLEKDSEFRASSIVALESFAKVSADELSKMHKNFIRVSGGKVGKEKVEVLEIGGKKPFDKLREEYPQAYRRWEEGEEKRLQELFGKGQSISNIARKLGRKPGGIRARLIKLGLIEEEPVK